MTLRRIDRAAVAAAVLLAAATGHALMAARASPHSAAATPRSAAATSSSAATSQSTAPTSQPAPFIATYTIAWHGVTAGTSTLELRETAPQVYLYTSTDKAYGVFRLAFPHPLRQSSRFRIIAGEVQPLAFQAGGAGNDVMAQFDWKSGQVTGMAKGKLLDLKLQS